jgi:cbb3-type cytochrome oxidase maturation protein
VPVLAVGLDVILFALAALVGLASWCVYLWAVRDGQFKGVEEPAERLLELDARDVVPASELEDDRRGSWEARA